MAVVKTILWTVIVVIAGLVLFEAVRLLMLKHDVTVYRRYWEKQSSQVATPDSTLYIALGDSAAQGIGASKPEKGYVGLLAAQIAKTSGTPVQIINLSVTGAKVQDVIKDQLPRLKQMNLPMGTVITIEVGANNMGSFKADTFTRQMDELMRQLPPQTIISDMPYFGGGRAKNKEPDAAIASNIVDELAAKYKLKIAKLHEKTKNNDSIWVYGADFFHPSDRGYVNWYQAFQDAMYQ